MSTLSYGEPTTTNFISRSRLPLSTFEIVVVTIRESCDWVWMDGWERERERGRERVYMHDL